MNAIPEISTTPPPRRARKRMTLRERLAVASRAFAAIVGGYALAALFSTTLALALVSQAWPKDEAVKLAGMSGFLFYACAVIWVFAVRSAWRAWIGIGIVAALCGGAYYILQPVSAA